LLKFSIVANSKTHSDFQYIEKKFYRVINATVKGLYLYLFLVAGEEHAKVEAPKF
jgi:hypothetical protein